MSGFRQRQLCVFWGRTLSVGVIAVVVGALSGGWAGQVALVIGAYLSIYATAFLYLRAVDRGDRLAVGWWLVPFRRCRIRYDTVRSAERVELTAREVRRSETEEGELVVAGRAGPAVRISRRSPQGPSTWRDTATVIIGSDDADRLVEFLNGKAAEQAAGRGVRDD